MSNGSHKVAKRKIRYAVVGLGHIAQVAVLPAFHNASKNSELTALVSNDPTKLAELSEKYATPRACSYDDYDALLTSGDIDAVYIALPNHLHCEYSVRAAEAGVHVLCEKPMAVTEDECEKMIHAVEENDVRLMIAYRLHFEEANLRAIEIVKTGQIGEPRLFHSMFSMQVRDGNVRTRAEMGGGTLYDLGVYCINAARYLFQAEPYEVVAFSSQRSEDPRFAEIDEMTSAILRFPGDRQAVFTTSFGAADVSEYRIAGTKGNLRLDPAYEYAGKLVHELTVDGRTTRQTFRKRDQFAPQLIHFSQCILDGKTPEPSGREALADVRIVRGLYESARSGQPVKIQAVQMDTERPSRALEQHEPPVSLPDVVHAENPST